MPASIQVRRAAVALVVGGVLGGAVLPGGFTAQADAQGLCYDARLSTLVDYLSDLEAEVQSSVTLRRHQALYVRARRAYKRVRWARVRGVCLKKVGVPAEKALNAYGQASNAWSACIRNYRGSVDCTESPWDDAVQAKWNVASRQLAIARRYSA